MTRPMLADAHTAAQESMSWRRWKPGWWGVVALFWTAQGLSSASQIQLMMRATGGGSWDSALRMALASSWLWVPLTMLAFVAADRFPFARGRLLVPLAAHVAGALLVSAIRMAAVIGFNPWVGWYESLPSVGTLFVTSLQNNVFMYWLLVGIGHAILYARTSRIRGEQLTRAQLQTLKGQLRPHFLFNALNTISSMVRERPEMAERMIERLARLLRQSLDAEGTDEVALERELATLQPYLDIELARFEDRLRFDIDVAPDALGARVPHLLLQPIVENSVRHGLARMAAPGVVTIRSRRVGDALEVEVLDNGVGLPASFDVARTRGLGLSNTMRRLHQLYGAGHSFDIGRAEPGTRVRVLVPYRPAEAIA